MLNALRAQRNRPYLHVLVFVQLVSLVSVLVFSTCAMPSTWRTTSTEAQPANCSETSDHGHSLGHAGHGQAPVKDCSYKPCFASQPNPIAGFAIEIPNIPVFVLSLILITWGLLLNVQVQSPPRANSPPDGRRIPLIYRFCTLLN